MSNAVNRIYGDFSWMGLAKFASIELPADAVGAEHINPLDPLDAVTIEHEFQPVVSQEATAAAVAAIVDVRKARGPGTIVEFSAWLVTPPDTASGGGGRTAIFDLLVNGTSVLTSPITLDHSSVSRVAVDATIATAAYADGNIFSVKITLGAGSTGTHPLGVAAAVTLREVGT